LNYFDVIVICLLTFGFIRGFLKGFFNEISTFLGFFIGLIGSTILSEDLSKVISKFVEIDIKIINIISFITLFILITILFSIIGKSLTKLVKFASLGMINRILGGVFSLSKYLVIFSFLVLVINYLNNLFSINILSKSILNDSLIFNILISVGDGILFLFDNRMMLY
tara:strand:- start:674 stop:1174 length:501 start_codon:yes stop_codon:yes gene_type:complete